MRRVLPALLLFIALLPSAASADVVISEIMYDLESGSDTGREWIEVFNAGSTSIRFVDWKLFEAETNHGVSAVGSGEELASGAYAIIADNPTKFLADWPGFSGLLFDSAFSLSNSGETLATHTPPPDFAASDSVTYQSAWGAAGDGQALQRASTGGTSFTPGAPTPGSGALTADTSGTSPAPSNTSPSNATTNSSQPVSSYVPALEPQLYAYAGKDRDAIAGADVKFEGLAYDTEGKPINASAVRFLWTFGDGGSANGEKVLHRFSEPGRYAVVLDLAHTVNSASARIIVNVHPVSINVSLRNGSIVLSNTSGRELDLSGWHLRSGPTIFTIPANTILLANATVPFSREVTGLSAHTDAALLYSNGTVAAGVSEHIPHPASAVVAPSIPVNPSPSAVRNDRIAFEEREVVGEELALGEYATTSPAQTAAASTTSPHLWWLGALVLTVFTAGTVFISGRMKKGEWVIEEGK